jgi:plastocyanin
MRRLAIVTAALVLASSGCGLGAEGNERTLLVDYSHDEFSSFMLDNFPSDVTVAPGTTLVFKQTWTGEPHTVTGGKLVDEMMKVGGPWFEFFEAFDKLAAEGALPDPENPSGSAEDLWEAVANAKDEGARESLYDAWDALRAAGVDIPDREAPEGSFEDVVKAVDEESSTFFEEDVSVPWAFDENEEGGFITQNAGQPCYLTKGGPPKQAETPCTEAQQEQPDFDGSATYYNSGIIPYEGAQGNTFSVPLADDIEPGDYYFYCAVHGPMQATKVTVTGDRAEADSQDEINRRARAEIAEFSEPMEDAFRDARDGKVDLQGKEIEGPFAGLGTPVHAGIDEFVPKTIRADVGEKVTWKIMGADHTISFDVPEYFPIMTFAKDGTVALNDKLQTPAGGSPKIADADEGQITSVDGGTYDGDGFFSSGLFGGEPYAEYSLRFSEPGTYRYACLLHPPMVGTVTVS